MAFSWTYMHEKIAALGSGAGDDAWFSTCDDVNRYYDEVFIVMGVQMECVSSAKSVRAPRTN